jgi:D-arginine dehydrogenase
MGLDFQVVIVGGGVLGISTAYHLSQRGISTLLLERELSFGVHSSGRNAGMIRQLYRHSQLTEWARRSIAEWPESVRRAAFRQTGSFVAGREVPDHHTDLFEQREVTITGGTGSTVSGVFAHSDGLIDPHDYLSELSSLIDKRFCQLKFSTAVQKLIRLHDGWTVQTNDGESFSCQTVVNAAGAWVNQILGPELGELHQPTAPYSRHLFMIHGWSEGFMPCPNAGFFWDEIDNWYMRRWDDQTRLVSICDETSSEPANYVANPSIGQQVAAKLIQSLPGVAEQLQLGRSWHCFRTYAPDRLPIVGPDPRAEGLFWLAAFGGFGMSTSFAASADAASFIAGEDVSLEPAFLPRVTSP